MEEKNKLVFHDLENNKAITIDRDDILEIGPSAVWKSGLPVTRIKIKPKKGPGHYYAIVAGSPETIGSLSTLKAWNNCTHGVEQKVEQSTNWEQRRWDAVLAIINGLNANHMFYQRTYLEKVSMAVQQADKLIEAYTKRPNE